jgi:hypothetical protein
MSNVYKHEQYCLKDCILIIGLSTFHLQSSLKIGCWNRFQILTLQAWRPDAWGFGKHMQEPTSFILQQIRIVEFLLI